jgi:signal transduction histidine kinase/ActR/RegA family two-component response regulator
MSLKTRWLASMLGVVLVGTAITTVISSSISFYGASKGGYEWLNASHRHMGGTLREQFFKRIEVQARLLTRMPALLEAISTRSPSQIQRHLDSSSGLLDGDVWAVVAEDGTVIATSDPTCQLEGVRGRPSSPAELTRSVRMCGRIPVFATTAAVIGEQGFLGWLVLGFKINEAYADAYFVTTRVELVVIDPEGTLVSTFLNTEGERITPNLGALPRDALWAEGFHFGKYELEIPRYRGYHGITHPLSVGVSSQISYLLSIPFLPDQPEVPLRAVLIVPRETMDIGAYYSTVLMVCLSLLLLPLLGWVVWRLVNGFVQPISLLGQMTARVAEGDLEAEAPMLRQDELGQLTRDFNGMVRKLKESQRRLAHSEKMAAVGQLAAGVGHEINNPLAYVTANLSFATEMLSELAGTKGGDAAQPLPSEVTGTLREVSEALREAQDGAQRVGRIVRDLRTFARSDDAIGEQRQVVQVHRIIESALKLASNTLKYHARVTQDFRETAPVMGNEARLVQVFINLLVNAAQAIPPGRAEENEIRVTTATGADGSVVVEVSDTGQGMSPEVSARLFEPFFTTKPVGQGTGLGLSISRNIIEGLGGSLTFQSTVGKGTTFRVTLPAAREEYQEGQEAVLSPDAPKQGGRVLVVDDEPFVGASAKRILGSVCEVVTVTSAREALEQVNAGQRFDLVLCDLMMPQMTGMELHTELSRRAPEVAARMLFLSGGAITPEAQQFLEARQWIEKPFDSQRLRARVSEWLREVRKPPGETGDALYSGI